MAGCNSFIILDLAVEAASVFSQSGGRAGAYQDRPRSWRRRLMTEDASILALSSRDVRPIRRRQPARRFIPLRGGPSIIYVGCGIIVILYCYQDDFNLFLLYLFLKQKNITAPVKKKDLTP